MGDAVADHSRIQTEYANFKSINTAGVKMKETTDTLKTMRPPTQPHADIALARKSIVKAAATNLHVIQLSLFTILLALLEYLLLPAEYAHGVAFLTLCVGTSAGIYLATL